MSSSPLNQSALLDTVDGDADFLGTLVETFLDDCPAYLAAIRTAVDEEDAEALIQEAHSLKGTLGLLHATPARRAAKRLEELGRTERLDEAPEALDALTDALDRLRPALREMVENVQAEG
ncbi:MAG: Hpt domain-containing protein [Salinibacter sp.]